MENIDKYYKLLKIAPNASLAELRLAYRHRVKQCHPDQFAGNTEQNRLAHEELKQLNIAYATLKVHIAGNTPKSKTVSSRLNVRKMQQRFFKALIAALKGLDRRTEKVGRVVLDYWMARLHKARQQKPVGESEPPEPPKPPDFEHVFKQAIRNGGKIPSKAGKIRKTKPTTRHHANTSVPWDHTGIRSKNRNLSEAIGAVRPIQKIKPISRDES